MAEPAYEPAPRRWGWKLLPYLVAAVAIAAILWRYPPQLIAAEMSKGDTLAMAPFALALVSIAIFILCASDYTILRGALTDAPSYLRVVRARAAVTVLAMLGYGAGVGGFGVWLARATTCQARLAAGLVLYKMSADLASVSLVATVAIVVGNPDVSRGLRIAAPTTLAVLMFLKLFSRYGPWSLERLPLALHPWRLISPSRALAAVGLRAINIAFFTLCVWAAANGFGMKVPLAVMATYFPIVLVVGSMPVNVGGFGAVQGAWLLLEPWASNGEQVIAFSILWQLLVAMCITLRGAPFMRVVTREIQG